MTTVVTTQPTRPRVEVSQPRCHRCRATDHLVKADGEPLVCRPCVDLLGGIAAQPLRSDDRILSALLERHGDVVDLQTVPADRHAGARLAWVWTEAWPS